MFPWGMRRDPVWSEFERLQRGVDDLFAAVTGTRRPLTGPLWRPAPLFPLLNVRKVENTFVVTAEVPGLKTDDLEIKVEGDTLSLKGERKPYDAGSNASYHRRERASGTFQRSLTLPARVDPENVVASYKNGVLSITLPVEKPAEAKQIQIKAD